MSKKLNETTIVNELRGHSAFFRDSAARTPERPATRTGERPNTSTPERADTQTGEQVNVRTQEPVNGSTSERQNRRTSDRRIVRHSFNFYQDQVVALKRLVAQRALDGEAITLSDIARQAIDDFLVKENSQN
jgi:hypothetical protein